MKYIVLYYKLLSDYFFSNESEDKDMRKLNEYNHLFFQKMQSGALILKTVKTSKNFTDFQIISSNEYIYDLKKLDEDLHEDMLSNLSPKSELFAAIENAVNFFYTDGIESHRYVFEDKSLLIKMNIFYIQKGVICVLIREKNNLNKNYDIAGDELLELFNACFYSLNEWVIIADYDSESILLSNLEKKFQESFSNQHLKSLKISNLLSLDIDLNTIKGDLNRIAEPNTEIYSEGMINFQNTINLPFVAKFKKFELNNKVFLLIIGLNK